MITKKRFSINFKDWEFEFQQRDRHTILMADFWSRSFLGDYYERQLKLPVGQIDALFTGNSRGYNKIKQKRKQLRLLKEAARKESYLRYLFGAIK